jgi:hypothetical protein
MLCILFMQGYKMLQNTNESMKRRTLKITDKQMQGV